MTAIIKYSALLSCALLAVGPAVTSANAQQRFRSVIASAGGIAANESFRMASTLGEPLVGTAMTEEEAHVSGFWAANATPMTGTPVEDVDLSGIPETYRLDANYPNPFNPQTTIQYGLPETARVTLRVYDSVGRLVEDLVDQTQSGGIYRVQFAATDLPSGLYFYRLETGTYTEVRSMLLVK